RQRRTGGSTTAPTGFPGLFQEVKPVSPRSALLMPRGLSEEAEPEAEDLLFITRPLHDGEAEVQGNRHRPEHGNGEAHAESGRHAVVADFHTRFDSAGVDKPNQVDLVIGKDRHLVFQAIEEHEVTADRDPVNLRADATELEAAHALETTGKETFVD